MLPENLERVLSLPDDARVLDVGGWAAPVNRADWVIDLMPYATRGALMRQGFGPGPERFDEQRWVVADICGAAPWPFDDDFFDFAICTFTLEDLRDPIRTCEEMSRVAKAGYIEVPSLLDELTWMNPEGGGGPWLGHSHHRWLCTLEDGELVFLMKAHSLHSLRSVRVPPRWARRLTVHDRILAHFWEGSLPARERPAIDSYPTAELERTVRDHFNPSTADVFARRLVDRLGRSMRWRMERARARLRSPEEAQAGAPRRGSR
jgi:hypothetical protein